MERKNPTSTEKRLDELERENALMKQVLVQLIRAEEKHAGNVFGSALAALGAAPGRGVPVYGDFTEQRPHQAPESRVTA